MKKTTCRTVLPTQQEAIEAALPLVGWTVRRYFTCKENVVGLAYEDLYQEGCVAVCQAVADYDPKRAQFQTFVVTVIRNHLLDYCRAMTCASRCAPTVSLDQMTEEGSAEQESMNQQDLEEELLDHLHTADFLKARKDRYQGAARLGVEALELKIMGGYGVTDIAKRYGSRPNQVGAWISRAVKKIRSDLTEDEKSFFGVEKAS